MTPGDEAARPDGAVIRDLCEQIDRLDAMAINSDFVRLAHDARLASAELDVLLRERDEARRAVVDLLAMFVDPVAKVPTAEDEQRVVERARAVLGSQTEGERSGEGG